MDKVAQAAPHPAKGPWDPRAAACPRAKPGLATGITHFRTYSRLRRAATLLPGHLASLERVNLQENLTKHKVMSVNHFLTYHLPDFTGSPKAKQYIIKMLMVTISKSLLTSA